MAEGGGGGDRGLTTNDALAYIKEVKDTFRDEQEKILDFFQVMKDFKAQRIDRARVIERVKGLFEGHRRLILGFNDFLPTGNKIALPLEMGLFRERRDAQEEATNYVNRIMTRFQGENHVFNALMGVLSAYKRGAKPKEVAVAEAKALFQDRRDLFEEFVQFISDTPKLASAPPRNPAIPTTLI